MNDGFGNGLAHNLNALGRREHDRGVEGHLRGFGDATEDIPRFDQREEADKSEYDLGCALLESKLVILCTQAKSAWNVTAVETKGVEAARSEARSEATIEGGGVS